MTPSLQKRSCAHFNEDQAARYGNVLRERSLVRYQATVAWCVVQLDKSVGLSDEQRRRLVELLMKETRPPKRFGQNDYWYMMLQASKFPESKIKPIFDNVQWRILQRQLMQGRGMEQWLKMSGVMEDDKPAGGNAWSPTPCRHSHWEHPQSRRKGPCRKRRRPKRKRIRR